MRKFKILLFCVVLFIISCSADASKFVGKWKQVNQADGQIMIIEKKENGYDMYPEKLPDRFLNFIYSKDHDQLTSNAFGVVVDIKCKKDNGHILMSPRNGGMNDELVEYEKVK